jgi:hypothetical protein
MYKKIGIGLVLFLLTCLVATTVLAAWGGEPMATASHGRRLFLIL